MLKANGFRWSPAGGFWVAPGSMLADKFLSRLGRKIGPCRPDGRRLLGMPGQSREGYFRPFARAATPVYCDACHKAA